MTIADDMLRSRFLTFGIPRRITRRISLSYFKKHGCMHCSSKKKPHHRFALCKPCYVKFSKEIEQLEKEGKFNIRPSA